MPELTSISTAIVPAPLPALPEKKKGGRPRGLGRRGVLKEAERQMVQAAPEVLKKYWAAVEKGLEAGEKWAADAVRRSARVARSFMEIGSHGASGGVSLSEIFWRRSAAGMSRSDWPLPRSWSDWKAESVAW